MKITCPKCNANGTIPDHEVPEEGRFVSCPRCHEGFSVKKPRADPEAYLVDTCPACSFSTFGDETFSSCPACGINVKSYTERKREEVRVQHDQQLLARKFSGGEAAHQPPVSAPAADAADMCTTVNYIGWGGTIAGILLLIAGIWGIVGFDGGALREQMMESSDEQISTFSVFMQYGFKSWVTALYGAGAVSMSLLFVQRRNIGLTGISTLIWIAMVLVPVSYIAAFAAWVMSPVPHTLSGYLSEILNMTVMSALVTVPLYLLNRYIHQRSFISRFSK